MDPQVNTVSRPPPRSSDPKMALDLDTKEDLLVNGHEKASDAKEGNAKMRFWSNRILVETFIETNYLKKPSPYEEDLIMRMYLRWYMGFEMGSINPAELVCQMALLTPSSIKGTSIFENYFGRTNFDGNTYPLKTRRTLIPVRNVRLPELTPQMLNSYYIFKSPECNTKEQLTELGENEKSEICSFYSHAKSTLSITDKNDLKRISLKCYFGLSALVTLRLISKQALTVQTFLKKRFRKMFLLLFQLDYYHYHMCGPHLKSLDDVKRGLDLRLPNIKITLHAIILRYVFCPMHSNYSEKAVRFMLYSLLSFIQLHGLPLVRLYLRLSFFSPDLLVDMEKSASSELLSNLFKHYYGEVSVTNDICDTYISHEDSWKWCRLLDDSYFSEFKIESNAKLAYNMAGMVATMSNQQENMWNMVGFKNNLDIDMKKEAEIFCESIKLAYTLRVIKELKQQFRITD